MTIQENISLAPYTTLGVGGPARFFFRAVRESDLFEAVQLARDRGLPIFVLGGGSNLLVSDQGFPGLVLQVAIEGPVHSALCPERSFIDFEVPAGMDWDAFVRLVATAGYTGVECLAGIPGKVGGSPIQNIGAYGQEVSQTIHSVRALALDSLEVLDLPAEDCRFAYRTSIFNSTHRNRYIVSRVTFRLPLHAIPKLTYPELERHFADRPNPSPLEIYEAVRTIRAEKGMLAGQGGPDSRSAGSFFKNPIVPAATLDRIVQALSIPPTAIPHWPAGQGTIKLSAAWLVERSGFPKGFHLGDAGISTRHTLALVNLGSATAADILALRDAVLRGVKDHFAIELEQEPVLVGPSAS